MIKFIFGVLCLMSSCAPAEKSHGDQTGLDAGTDTDPDTDTDSDSDTDSHTNTDTMSDSDTTIHPDTETQSDSETDTDVESDTGNDSDTQSDNDSDSVTETESATDTEYDSNSESSSDDVIIEITDDIKLKGNALKEGVVFFVFDPSLYVLESDFDFIEVRGTFTGWDSHSEFILIEQDDIFILRMLADEIWRPGNSGQPEFKFVVNSGDREIWVGPSPGVPPGYYFQGNFILLSDADDPADIVRREAIANTIKDELSDFDDLSIMANFRPVKCGKLGENVLFRSYHPFIMSRRDHPLEEIRLAKVQEYLEEHRIAAIVNLSETSEVIQEGSITEDDQVYPFTIPSHYQTLLDEQAVLLRETDYNIVFYESDGTEFGELALAVINFMANANPPYLIHCRLGTDRTGVITALIELLMGCSWKEISEDFSISNEMGLGEYRDKELLKYSVERMLGQEIDDDSVLDNETKAHLIEQGVLKETIDKLTASLGLNISYYPAGCSG